MNKNTACEQYVNPEQLKKQGFVKRSEGGYYKQNTLERYAKKGWLDMGDKRFTSEDRLKAGERLYSDFYKSGLCGTKVPDYTTPRVDCSNRDSEADTILDAKTRFEKAMKKVPSEFWSVLHRVVLEDEEFNIKNKKHNEYKEDLAMYKKMLNWGLDRLVFHYFGNQVRFGRVKVKGIREISIWDNFEDWYQENIA